MDSEDMSKVEESNHEDPLEGPAVGHRRRPVVNGPLCCLHWGITDYAPLNSSVVLTLLPLER